MYGLKPVPFKTTFCKCSVSEFISSQVNTRKVEARMSSLNDLEFAFAPLRDTVRDLREYL
jgi:hypothetical protein